MAYETEAWAYIQAKYYGVRRTMPTRLIVIHDAEFPEVLFGARGVAKYFQNPDPGTEPSAHISVDNQEVVQSVKDSYVAHGAPGANHDGIHIELVGYQKQKKEDWLDNYSLGVLALGADATAQYCLKYAIPAIKLTLEELAAGKRGIVGHDQVSQVYKRSDHTDPGPGFPWRLFIGMVQEIKELRK
jgi:N-acetyl-anhydromuramyl-L-alanine amidase AmpD